ncbi:hypothetical protein [Lacticaseibacillus daqingensis]|uniref:hypothetical protein n=1 Tax=Lacticaseibacillus daqingensis TaxID=2486014 RepID=UPI000F772D8A|nr:hypothetical protein [Lacticaseibacillus daqingensis]
MTETKQDVFEAVVEQRMNTARVVRMPNSKIDELRNSMLARYAAAADAPRPDYDIHTDLDGDQYQLLTGRELIAGLADDAMQDEQLGNSYRNVLAIVPNRKYKAYLDSNAGSLNGEWEEV